MPTDLLQQKLSAVAFTTIDTPKKGVPAPKIQQKPTALMETTMSNDDLVSQIAKFQAEVQNGQSLMQSLQKHSHKHEKKSKKE